VPGTYHEYKKMHSMDSIKLANHGSVPSRARDFSHLQSVQTSLPFNG